MNEINVFGYARKSPDDKEDTETSILNQTKLIKSICEDKGWHLVDIFIDSNVSGSDTDRKEFGIMIERTIRGEADYIVVKDQKRFARNTSVFRNTIIDLKAHNKKVYAHMKFGFLDWDDLGDAIKSVVDDNYVIVQKKNTDLLFEQKIKEGLPICKSPFGYNNTKNGFSVNNKESKIVNSVCLSYSLGADYKSIIKENKIDKSKYYRIIKNAKNGLYNGYIYYEKKIKDSNKRIIRIDPITYKGSHKPIISEEIFRKINPTFSFP